MSAGPTGTLGTAPTTTTTAPPPVDPSVIPADPTDIDERYLQAVVDALFAVDAEATKIFVETKQLDQRGIDILGAIYVPDAIGHRNTFGPWTSLSGPTSYCLGS